MNKPENIGGIDSAFVATINGRHFVMQADSKSQYSWKLHEYKGEQWVTVHDDPILPAAHKAACALMP